MNLNAQKNQTNRMIEKLMAKVAKAEKALTVAFHSGSYPKWAKAEERLDCHKCDLDSWIKVWKELHSDGIGAR